MNLSDAFTFEEKERLASENDMLEMQSIPAKERVTGILASAEDVASQDTFVHAAGDADTEVPASL